MTDFDTYKPRLDAEVVTDAMSERRAALSGRAIESPEEASDADPEYVSDIAPFAGGGWRRPSVLRSALEADGLPETAEEPLELPPEWVDRSVLRPDDSPHPMNPLALEKLPPGGVELEPVDEESDEEEGPEPAQRVILTAKMAGAMSDDELAAWFEEHE